MGNNLDEIPAKGDNSEHKNETGERDASSLLLDDLYSFHSGFSLNRNNSQQAEKLSTLPSLSITDSGSIFAGISALSKDAAFAPAGKTEKEAGQKAENNNSPNKNPESAKARKHLDEQQEKDGRVQKGEGPYQVAARLLGKDASHEEKMALTKAMKEQYKKETENKDPQMRGLKVGHSLLNESNYTSVLDNVKDKSIREKIAATLKKGENTDPKQEPEKPKQEPEKPKQEPEQPKQEPEKPTQEPEKPEQKPEQPKPDQEKNPEPEKAPEEKKIGPLGTAFAPVEKPQRSVDTIASVYKRPQETASGRYFNPNELTVAIKPSLATELGLKFGDVVKVTRNGKSVEAVYTDAGPFVKGRGIDLSVEVGRRLGITIEGIGIGAVSFEKVGREPGYKKAPPGQRARK